MTDSLTAKILALEAEVWHWREANRASLAAGDILLDELSALRVQLAAAQKDAERYHWLKESQTLFYKPTKYDGRSFGRWTCMWPTDNDDLDNAIDEGTK